MRTKGRILIYLSRKLLWSLLVAKSLIGHAVAQEVPQGTINRRKLVTRHNIEIKSSADAAPSQLGNGHFAYNFDITGLESFNPSFTTMADWGRHSFLPPAGKSRNNFKKIYVDTYGRMVPYDLPDENLERTK